MLKILINVIATVLQNFNHKNSVLSVNSIVIEQCFYSDFDKLNIKGGSVSGMEESDSRVPKHGEEAFVAEKCVSFINEIDLQVLTAKTLKHKRKEKMQKSFITTLKEDTNLACSSENLYLYVTPSISLQTAVTNNNANDLSPSGENIGQHKNKLRSKCKNKGTLSDATTDIQNQPFSFNSPNASAVHDSSVSNTDFNQSDTHSTPICAEKALPKPRRVKFHQRNNIISKEKCQKIASIVKQSVYGFHVMCMEWQKSKIEGGKYLQGLVEQKLDSHGQITRNLSFIAVQHMSDFSEVMKFMCHIPDNFEGFMKAISELQLDKDQFETFKPFSSMSLITIIEYMDTLRKSYLAEYQYKKAACRRVIEACSVSEPADHCANMLNSIVSLWSNDIHIRKKDPLLAALVEEVGGIQKR